MWFLVLSWSTDRKFLLFKLFVCECLYPFSDAVAKITVSWNELQTKVLLRNMSPISHMVALYENPHRLNEVNWAHESCTVFFLKTTLKPWKSAMMDFLLLWLKKGDMSKDKISGNTVDGLGAKFKVLYWLVLVGVASHTCHISRRVEQSCLNSLVTSYFISEYGGKFVIILSVTLFSIFVINFSPLFDSHVYSNVGHNV